jgi:uncharacterized protein with ParB-like and HNH nuclease domain
MSKYEEDELQLQENELVEDEPYIQYDIATYPSDFTLSVLHQMWKKNDITIPEWQREFVWSMQQSSLLIESFLLGLPVPPVFFYIDEENKNLVVDGQQRILSVCFYFEGFFGDETKQGKRQVFRLQGLDERSPYHKKTFKELDESGRRKLENAVLRALNIRQLGPEVDKENTSVYHIFERLNTGGTPLKPQEIRNCVFRGDIVKALRNLNNDENWRSILGKPIIDKHQKDVELVLRIFALSTEVKHYEKPMKEFLNKVMKKNRKADSPVVQKFQEDFVKIAKFIVETLGPKPFHIRGPLNASVLDSVFCTLMINSNAIPQNIGERYTRLKADDIFAGLTLISTSDTKIVTDRFLLAKKYLID